jgi:hypothetical protein
MPLTEQEQIELDLLERELGEQPQAEAQSSPQAPQVTQGNYSVSKAGSALAGAGQMASGGFIDEVGAGIGALGDVTSAAMGNRGDISFKDAYRTRKNQSDQLEEASASQNPWSYLGGGVAGGAMLGGVVPAANPATFKGAAALGGVYGAGGSKENPLDNFAGFGRDVATGAGGGVAGKYAGDKVGNLYKSLREKGKSRAIDELFRRKSGMAEDIIRFKKEGTLGEALTEMGPNGERPIVSGIRRGSDMLDPIRERTAQYSGNLATARGDVDAYNLGHGSGNAIVKELKNLDVMKSNYPGDQGAKNQIMEVMDYFRGRNDITMDELQRLKEISFNWKKISPAQQNEKGQDLTNQINKIIANEQRNVAERGAGMTAIPEMEQNLRNYPANQSKVSALIDAEKAALKEGGKDIGNRNISPTDYLTGAGAVAAGIGSGMVSGSPTVAAAVALALGIPAVVTHKFLRERGNTIASRAFIQLSNALDNQGVSAKYMPLIQAAARRGPEAMAILHLNLMKKDPEYKTQFTEVGQ